MIIHWPPTEGTPPGEEIGGGTYFAYIFPTRLIPTPPPVTPVTSDQDLHWVLHELVIKQRNEESA